MAQSLEVYQGTITYNNVRLYKNGTKKMMVGFISIVDTHGNEASYKINSFRSQPTIQSEALGERGMAGKKVTVHGNFKENTWQGETNWELMCEKLYIEGMEQLAADAEAAGTPLPPVPPGQLPGANIAPMVPTAVPAAVAPAPVAPITVPAALPGSVPNMATPAPAAATPAPIAGGYIYQPQTMAPIGAPAPVVNVVPVVNEPLMVPVNPIPTANSTVTHTAPVAPGTMPTQPKTIPGEMPEPT